MDVALFRSQALAARRRRAWSDPLGANPLGLYALAWIVLALLLAAATGVAVVEVPRRATVRGYLAPDAGVIRVRTPVAGTVIEVAVREGDEVAAGTPLIGLGPQRSTVEAADIAGSVRRDHMALREELVQQRRLVGSTLEAELSNLGRRRAALAREVDALGAQLSTARDRAMTAAQRLRELDPLGRQGLLPMAQLLQQRDRADELQLDALRTEQLLLERSRQLGEVDAESSARSRQARARIAELDAALARNAMESRDAASLLEPVIRAPAAGRVLRIAARPGASLQAGQLAVTLAPAGAELRAVLLVPSRDAAMLAAGQEVILRLDAFPYQRFGSRKGRVVAVGGSVVLPGETEAPVAVTEPVFEVIALLETNSVDAYGKRWALRTDLTFEADIVLERISLTERLLDPLRAITRRNG